MIASAMPERVKHDRGLIRVDTAECKGYGLCIEACPPKVIALSEHLNHYGYRTATYAGSGCTGCGICFLACPEPGALTVMRRNAGGSRLDRGALSCAEAMEMGRKEAAA
jgi:2-oxoglutarate ferredoxin oxidoreductase subunit delta